jgi:peptidoglycan/LPS O-acetylase OafA/YrhL
MESIVLGEGVAHLKRSGKPKNRPLPCLTGARFVAAFLVVASWLAGLFCVQVYWPSVDNLFRWNGQAWSISCELFFYALFPLLLPPLARRLRSTSSIIAAMFGIYLLDVVLYLCVSGILARLISPRHSFLGYQTYTATIDAALIVFPPLRLGEFLIGMCIGLLALHPEPLLRSPFRANLLLGLCAVALVVLVGLPRFNPAADGAKGYLSVMPVLALVLVSLMSGLTIVTAVLESRLAVLLGEASYSLYLVHGFFVPGTHYTVLKYVMCVLGSIASSIVLYWYLERPARRIWRQVLGSRHLPKFKTVAFSGVVQKDKGPDTPASAGHTLTKTSR